jgi:hypothetical protein
MDGEATEAAAIALARDEAAFVDGIGRLEALQKKQLFLEKPWVTAIPSPRRPDGALAAYQYLCRTCTGTCPSSATPARNSARLVDGAPRPCSNSPPFQVPVNTVAETHSYKCCWPS